MTRPSAMPGGMLDSHTSASLEDFEHDRADSPLMPSRGALTASTSGGDEPRSAGAFMLRDVRRSDEGAGTTSATDLRLPPPTPPAVADDGRSDVLPPWSPAAWRDRPSAAGSGWYRHQPYSPVGAPSSRFGSSARWSASMARDSSAALDEDDPTLPANIPLPRGSMSPDKYASPSPWRTTGTSPPPPPPAAQQPEQQQASESDEKPKEGVKGLGNYIRFAVRAEVQHRTEPIEWLVSTLQPHLDRRAKRRLAYALWALLLSALLWPFLTRTPAPGPAPDLVKLAGLARSLEPLMYYSENGVVHLAELQETGVAVWDLGESVRVANMSGATTIVRELDELATSLQALSVQLAQFFPAVDSDIDHVLLVMEWAQRELAALRRLEPGGGGKPAGAVAAAAANLHALANTAGLLENQRTGRPTVAGRAVLYVFGPTPAQRRRATLQRTFTELLSALEESIATELARTAALFALFATIDGQFRNLQRFTVRELDEQERQESELLSSLWQRVFMGAGGPRLRKFERNRAILQSVRARTVANKNLLVEHNGKLLALKESLETLRRRLMSPLVQGSAAGSGPGASSAGLEEQIQGLEDTHRYLRAVRQSQRGKVMEQLYGAGNRVKTQRLEIDGLT